MDFNELTISRLTSNHPITDLFWMIAATIIVMGFSVGFLALICIAPLFFLWLVNTILIVFLGVGPGYSIYAFAYSAFICLLLYGTFRKLGEDRW